MFPAPVPYELLIRITLLPAQMKITVRDAERGMKGRLEEKFGHAYGVRAPAYRDKHILPGRDLPGKHAVKLFLASHFFEENVYVKPNWRASLNCEILRPLGWSSSTMSTVSS